MRFGSYTTIKQFAQSYVAPGEKLGSLSTFGIGAMAGLITVYVNLSHSQERLIVTVNSYCTQPLDSVKTRYCSPPPVFANPY